VIVVLTVVTMGSGVSVEMLGAIATITNAITHAARMTFLKPMRSERNGKRNA
jgi:H+/Cl- antiporter ClcA